MIKLNKIKKGNIVARKSYGKDIIFVVKNIIPTNTNKIAILEGLIDRIEADSDIQDLEIVEKRIISENIKKLDTKIDNKILQSKKNEDFKINSLNTRNKEKIITGKILHLDGDKKYSKKSYYYYKKLGLNAIVRNIPEYKQPKVVYNMLQIYNPDILVITGHDKKRDRLS